jgi:hypothetical protein
MNNSDRRFFLCTGEAVTADRLALYPNSHIIGELRYVLDEGKRVTALARWESSFSTRLEPPIKPAVDVYLIGDARDIKCRYDGCHNKERWEIGQAAFIRLLSRYGKYDMRDV